MYNCKLSKKCSCKWRWQTIALARNGRLDPELARGENSQLREVYSDFTNRFSIRENIKIPCFAYRRFAYGGIRFHHDIQISEWSVGEAIRSISTYEWWKVFSRLREATSSEKIIKLKTLVKDDIDINIIMDSNVEHDENIET